MRRPHLRSVRLALDGFDFHGAAHDRHLGFLLALAALLLAVAVTLEVGDRPLGPMASPLRLSAYEQEQLDTVRHLLWLDSTRRVPGSSADSTMAQPERR